MAMKLERLGPVKLREVWHDETDFTKWLIEEANLEVLNEALGIQLEIEGTEIPVGGYRADILAKDSDGDARIVIENQLGKTDHDHLGKILTYGAVLGAKTVVWISSDITDEHRKTLDWLNEIAGENLRVFGLEIELWRIGDSLPAPKFNLVCTPNELVSAVGSSTSVGAAKALQLEFWIAFNEYLEGTGTKLRTRRPRPQHWYDFAIGRSGIHLSLTVNTKLKRVGCQLYISHRDAKRVFDLLRQEQASIDGELGSKPEWMELPESHACRVIERRDGDITVRESWPGLFEWMSQRLAAFEAAFGPRVRALRLETDSNSPD